MAHGDTVVFGAHTIRCIATPCHTSSHICYHVVDGGEQHVFTGDTLFLGGCGRFFEGTAEQMYEALCVRLAALPDATVGCSHVKHSTHCCRRSTVAMSIR